MGVARWTHDGAFALPAGAGAVRSAAVSSGLLGHPTETYFALGTDQSPGVVVPAGALVGDPVVLEQGEDVLAAAVASEVSSFSPNADASANATAATPCFVFATWTSPSRLVRVEVDENTRTLRRAAGKTLPLGVNRVRAAVADPRRFPHTDGSTFSKARRVAHFVSDTSPSALVTVRVDDLAIVDALVFPLAMNGSRVRRGAIIEDVSMGSGISYWVTKPAADGEKIGSTLFRVAHGSADTSGGAVITGAYAFETHERDVAAVFVERTKKLSESAFGSDEATVAYVAFDAVAGNDGDVEGTGTDALHSCAVVALAERRDKRTGAFLGFERIATVLIPNARALTPVRVADGVATYATRGSPAELVEVDFFKRGVTETNARAVFANSGPDVPSHDPFQDSEILCVAFANATHFGATVLFAGGRVGAGGRRLLSAALAARGAAVGETWKARAC